MAAVSLRNKQGQYYRLHSPSIFLDCMSRKPPSIPAENDMLFLGIYNTITDNSPMLDASKKGPKRQVERQHPCSPYLVGNKTICKFIYGLQEK